MCNSSGGGEGGGGGKTACKLCAAQLFADFSRVKKNIDPADRSVFTILVICQMMNTMVFVYVVHIRRIFSNFAV